jgi:hypothetical protein
MSIESPATLDELAARSDQRYRKLMAGVIVAAAIGLFAITVIGLFAYVTRQSLCTFRADLQHRYDQTSEYMFARYPDGRLMHPGPVVGVPRATIIRNLDGQRRTLASLSELHC